MKRYNLFQKHVAMLLILIMIIGLLPTYTIAADGSGTAADPRLADPTTMNQWTDYFTELSTEFAGGVWTDKSVMTDASEFSANITMNDSKDNFLIALSAIAANQKIVGHASTPMDVMLVLDVSGSMDSSNKDTAMIQAANQAIGRLLSQNANNRVGVVLYSGNSSSGQNAGTNTATVILPLDHYTTSATTNIGTNREPQYIPVYLNLSGNSVSVNSSVRNSSNHAIRTGSKSVTGGTYIQNGLYKAWNEFSQVTDVIVPSGNAQAGIRRTPIVVLMSDGQPTLATDNYNQVSSSESSYGNGTENSTSWQTVFLTQLTAAWVKGKIQAHYNTTPKFYTLGLGTGNSNYATAVLDPSNSYNTLNTYWDRFFTNSVNQSGNVNVGTNNSAWRIYKDSNVKAMDYVDEYWLAADSDDLLDAFDGIIDTIELAGAEHVTLVEDIGEDMSGYITITDELGIFMEVKDVKGLVLGNTFFTGYELAKSLQESSMGTLQNPFAYGDEFIRTVQERLNIDNTTDAQALVMAAYADGQLAYNAQTGAYSNYIGWYSNDDGDYLGFWDKDTGITADGAPAGATWINKSYGYLGAAGDSDMMHVVVMISTHIKSGMQVVQYKIPASLIPTVTYEIELKGSDVTQMKSITRHEAFPLRLVYEVGLQDGINPVNVERKLQEAHDAGWGHIHAENDGSYAFYTNLWGAEEGDTTVDYNDPLNHKVAQSHFHPAVGNDRYYYTEDTPVYVLSGNSYVHYSGTAAPAGNGYYRAYHYYTENGYTTEYLPMSEYALEMAADNGRAADGRWYIPEGTIFQQVNRFKMLKDPNATGTLDYYDYPVVVDIGDKYDVYAFLGNNGKITMTPAQGIRLTKTVTETVAGAADTFTFKITLGQAVANPNVTDADGNAFTGAWSVDGNVITVALKAGQSVCITNLPTGITYTVEEVPTADYEATSGNAAGAVEANKIKNVDFVNTPKGYGNLIVSKDVDHPYINVPTALTNKDFTINVTLSGPDTANKQFRIAGTNNYVTTDAGGTFSVKLKDNSSLTVVGLPEGTTFITTETLDTVNHKGFTMDASRSTLSGTIVKNTTVQTHVVNVYAPSSPVTSIDVVGTKTLVDETGTFDWTGKSFTIRLEQYDPTTGTYVTVDETTVTDGKLDFAFVDKLEFNAIGTYYYKVSEVIPADRLKGMSYDATAGRFEVRVTDNDVNGELEFEVYDFDTQKQISGNNYVYTFEKNFTNTHTMDATFVEFTVDKDVVDPHNTGLTEAGYLFELFEVVDGVVSTIPAYSMRTVLVNGQGQATFHIPVTKVGSRTFILKEIAPTDVDKIPGMKYDDAEYTVIVSATAENDKLVPAVTFNKNGTAVTEDDLVFKNVMDLDSLVLKPHVTKTLNGREPLNDSEFTFNIVQTDGSFATPIPGGYSDTVSVGEGDKYFEEITVTTVGTYYFRITEVIGNAGGMTYDNSIYHVTVDITVENGKLVKDVTYLKVGEGIPSTETDFVQFTNTYVNNDTKELVLRGEKSLTGRTLITGEFRFQLSENGTVLQTVTNRADGSFVFAPITYTAADVGTHSYTITELDDDKGGVAYDGSTYTVIVTVTDNGDGTLSVSDPVYTKGNTPAGEVVFRNTYSTEDTQVSFGGTKTWYNTDLSQNITLTGGEFTFVLYNSNESYSVQGTEAYRTTNAADGTFGFTLDYDTPGTYYYLLRELVGDDAGVIYDTSVFRIKISVYDNGLGKLVHTVPEIHKVGTNASTITFSNLYTPKPTTHTLTATKNYDKDLTGGEFEFVLTGMGENQTKTNGAQGAITFDELTFTESGIYTYTVTERAGDKSYITYDDTVYTVAIEVADDGEGQLYVNNVTVSDNKNSGNTSVIFDNAYVITGESVFTITGTKNLTGREIVNGEFTFVLTDSENNTVEVTNVGKYFSFNNVKLPGLGTHTFTITEKNTGAGTITYDPSVYTVTINVVDNNEGGMTVETPVITLGGKTAELTFNNVYTAPDAITVDVNITKTVQGALSPKGFQFELVQNGKVIATVTTDDNGKAVLPITFTAADIGNHEFVLREVDTGVKHVTYDTTEHKLLIGVAESAKTQLTASVKLDNATVETVNVTFVNKYNPPATPQTGDNSNPAALVSIMSISALMIIALAAILIVDKRKHMTRH